MTTKENNGKARQLRWMHRLYTATACLLGLVALAVVWRTTTSSSRSHLRNRQQPLYDKQEILQRILSGELTLVNLQVAHLTVDSRGNYQDVVGEFCRVDWTAHKETPANTPMFRDVVAQSHDCLERYPMDLRTVVDAARAQEKKRGRGAGR